ncbi:hypothetical protein L211DRAFT_817063 [Terfezia boudieri ATCC MYA-4762]|uniref:Uncharacterized protein n=1 Tax=Terfezia boudieri ATCC MYA-4762 TaxID=1051890 RepID=A0A3N4M7U7_9PEZI|nr:hypothetical protein L211DRAFT_817063 [Terfezia boudieri ATCC MYA-4762]
MSGSNERSDADTSTYHRRASFSPGTSLTELFTGRAPPPPYPGPNAAAAQRARAMSISGPSTSGISAFRRESISSINSSASNLDENAVDEGEGSPTGMTNPFTRRMSFGARAMRDLRLPGKMGAQGGSVPFPTAARGEPHYRRLVRIVLIMSSGTCPDDGKSNSPPLSEPGENPHHQRRPSASTMPLPVSSTKANYDPMGERILKGDFYMD